MNIFIMLPTKAGLTGFRDNPYGQSEYTRSNLTACKNNKFIAGKLYLFGLRQSFQLAVCQIIVLKPIS
jgi:hypothetical protein